MSSDCTCVARESMSWGVKCKLTIAGHMYLLCSFIERVYSRIFYPPTLFPIKI
jgi:hypothetical protein